MTTTVIIEARLLETKEVHIEVVDKGEVIETTLQEGETIVLYVHDKREIRIKEVEK